MPSRHNRSRGWGRRRGAKAAQVQEPQKVVKRGLELEALEPRVLLTTLFGGDVFEFIDGNGEIIRVAIEGDVIAELVGGAVDEQNEFVPGGVPGHFLQTDIPRGDILGGFGGLESLLPVSDTAAGTSIFDQSNFTLIDPEFGTPFFTSFPVTEDNANITIQALAAQAAQAGGGTYGFNVGETQMGDDTFPVVQMVAFDTPDINGDGEYSGVAHVQANLQGASFGDDTTALNEALTSGLEGVEAFALNPTKFGVGYAVNPAGVLFRLDTVTGSVVEIGELENSTSAMAANDDGELWILTQDIGSAATTHLQRIDTQPGGGDVLESHEILTGPGAPEILLEDPADPDSDLGRYTGMTFDEDGNILAVGHFFNEDGEGQESFLHEIVLSAGVGYVSTTTATFEDVPELHGLTFGGGLNLLDEDDVEEGGSRFESVLLSVDHSEDAGPRLVEIGPGGGFTVLNQAGLLSGPGDLTGPMAMDAAVMAQGERPVLFSVSGDQVLRGTNVSLPTDEDGETLVEAITGSSFRPHTGHDDDGRLYFTVLYDNDVEVHQLWSIDVTLNTRTEIQGSMILHGALMAGDPEVTSIAWEQTGQFPDDATLWAGITEIGTVPLPYEDAGDETFALVEVDAETAGIMSLLSVHELGQAVDSIEGLEFVFSEDDGASHIYGVRAGEDVVRVNLSTGGLLSMGPTTLVGGGLPLRGDSLEGLAWNETLVNPFTGEQGVLLATDTVADEMYFVDHRHRPGPGASEQSGHAFAIFITQGDVDGSIAISRVNPDPPPYVMMPYDGSIGDLRVFPTDGGAPIVISAPGQTGMVQLGAKTLDLIPGADDDLWGIASATLEGYLDGMFTRPAGMDDLLNDDGNDLSAGIRVVESLLRFLDNGDTIGERLMGQRLNDIVAMGVSRDGTIAVVDADQISAGGERLEGYELALLNPNTGAVAEVGDGSANWLLMDMATGLPLSGVTGLDFADLANIDAGEQPDGRDELFALLESFDFRPFFSLGSLLPADADDPTGTVIGTGLEDFRALAVTGNGMTVFGAARNEEGTYDLYRINRDTVTGEVEETLLLGEISDQAGNAITDIESMEIDELGTLYVSGWNLDAPVPNASLGRLANPGDILLEDLHDGAGIGPISGGTDLQIQLPSLATFTVDFDGATTLQDVIDAINEAPGNALTATFTFESNPLDGHRIGIHDGTQFVFFEFDADGTGGWQDDPDVVRVQMGATPAATRDAFVEAVNDSDLDVEAEMQGGVLEVRHLQPGAANGLAYVQNDALGVEHTNFFATRASFNEQNNAIQIEYREGTADFFINDVSGIGAALGLEMEEPASTGFPPFGADVPDGVDVFVGENLGVTPLMQFSIQDLALDPNDESRIYTLDTQGALTSLGELIRGGDGQVDSYSVLEARFTSDGEYVVGLRTIDVHDDNGESIFHVIGMLPSELVPSEPLVGDLGRNIDITDVMWGEADGDMWFVEDWDVTVGIDGGGHTFTNLLNLARIEGDTIDGVAVPTLLGDNFGNALEIFSVGGSAADGFYTLADNESAPRPSANIGGDLGDAGDPLEVFGTAIDTDQATYVLHRVDGDAFLGVDDAFELVQLVQDADGTVTDTIDFGVIETGNGVVEHIYGMAADHTDPGVLYVIGNDDGGTEMHLFRIEVDTATQSLDVTQSWDLGYDTADETPGELRGLVHDPGTDDFYTVAHEFNGPALMRFDMGSETFGYAGPAQAQSLLGGQGTIIDSIAINGAGDLIAVEGGVGGEDRNLLHVHRVMSGGFSADFDASVADRVRIASDDGSIDSGMRDLAVDPVSGRFFAVNTLDFVDEAAMEAAGADADEWSDFVETRSELWVSAPELWYFTTEELERLADAPVPNWSTNVFIDNTLGGALDIRGLGVGPGGNGYVTIFDGDDDEFRLLSLTGTSGQPWVPSVTGSGFNDLFALEHDGDPLIGIHGMTADHADGDIVYVVAAVDDEDNPDDNEMHLFQVNASTGDVDLVMSLDHEFGEDPQLRGLVQDPDRPDEFYTVRHDGAGPVLMRIDTTANTFLPASQTNVGQSLLGEPGDIVDSLVFNEKGDLLAITGQPGEARQMLSIDREATGNFRVNVVENVEAVTDDPAVEGVPSASQDFAMDPDRGVVLTVRNDIVTGTPDGLQARNQIWFAGEQTEAVSQGVLELDGIAVLGDSHAIEVNEDGYIFSVLRQDVNQDGVGDVDLLFRFDVNASPDLTLAPNDLRFDADPLGVRGLGAIEYVDPTDPGTVIASQVMAMTFTEGAELIGYDDAHGSGRLMLALNQSDAGESVALTDPTNVTVPNDLVGLALGQDSRLVSTRTDGGMNTEVLLSGNQQELFTFTPSDVDDADVTGEIDLGVGIPLDGPDNIHAASYRAMAIDEDGQIWAIARFQAADYLVRIDDTTGEVTVQATVERLGQSTRITAMQWTARGELIGLDESGSSMRVLNISPISGATTAALPADVVISDDLTGLTTDNDGRFYSINRGATGDDLWVSGHQAYAMHPMFNDNPSHARALSTLTVDGRAVVHAADGLAINRATNTLHMVIDRGDGSRLVNVNLASGVGADEGLIRIDGELTDISAMVMGPDGVLVAVDDTAARLVAVDGDEPYISRGMTQPNSYNVDFVGLTVDNQGRSFAILPGDDDDGTVNELWMGPGESAAFGRIEMRTQVALFEAYSFVNPEVVSQVHAAALHPTPGEGVYLVGTATGTGERQLFKMDAFTGETLTIGNIDREIKSMDFEGGSNNPRLLAHDAYNGQLVDIDYRNVSGTDVPVGQVVETSEGSLRPTVGAIAYDTDGKRFLAADNVTRDQSAWENIASTEAPFLAGMTMEELINFLLDALVGEFAPATEGSAVLMELTGTESDSAEGQHLNRLLIGGTVMGRVVSAGSIDTMYAGWLPVGDIQGTFGPVAEADPNFSIAGDVRNLVVASSIGTHEIDNPIDPTYSTGFHMHVGGKLGNMEAYGGDILGKVNVEGDAEAPGISVNDRMPREVQGTPPTGAVLPWIEGILFEDFELWREDGLFNNHDFDNPQRLGTYSTGVPGEPDIIRVQGELNFQGPADNPVDYYSAALMAGEVVTVQLFHDLGEGLMHVGIFDPDGRLVATDYDRHSVNAPFQFRADRPGEYRIAVGYGGDVAFDGDWNTAAGGINPYILELHGAGNMSVGGIVGGHITLLGDTGLRVARDDLGAVFAEGSYSHLGVIVIDPDFTFPIGLPGLTDLLPVGVVVDEGDMRSVSMGVSGVDEFTWDESGFESLHIAGVHVSYEINQGNIGLLESRDGPLRPGYITVDGNIQVIDAAADFGTQIEAGGGIGIIRADNISNAAQPTVIEINRDHADHYIGLVDIQNVLNGAEFVTNPGGDLHYMRVGGAINSPFGGNVTQTHDPGAAYVFQDDSGTELRINPRLMGDEPVDQDGDIPDEFLPFLTTRVYPLLGTPGGGASAGLVLVDVVSTGGIDLEVVRTPSGHSAAHVGTLIALGEGRETSIQELEEVGEAPEEFDVEVEIILDDLVFSQAAGNNNLAVTISNRSNGSGALNVWDVRGEDGGGDFTRIENLTRGDIVNVNADSVWELRTGGNLGVTDDAYGATLVAHAANSDFGVADTFPFLQQTTGVNIGGEAWWISAGKAVGNVHVDGHLFGLIANKDFQPMAQDEHWGINAPVYVAGYADRINIGHGILASGSGAFSQAGVYVDGELGRLHNDGQPAGSDIRGTVNAIVGIDQLRLTNGSIIDAVVGSVIFHEDTTALATGSVALSMPDTTFETPVFTVGEVNIRGNGGIIGSLIWGGDIERVRSNGFGILNSVIIANETGQIGRVTAGGLGIHDTTILAGGAIGTVEATGRGDLLDLMDYNSTVRQSENHTWDPYSLKLVEGWNDLHQFFGTTASESSVEELTIAGMLRDITVTADRTLDRLSGYRMEATDSVGGAVRNIVMFGGRIGTISTIDTLSDLYLQAGRLDRFQPGGDVMNAQMDIAGSMNLFRVQGDFGENSQLNLHGPDAGLSRFIIDGDMEGDLLVRGSVNLINIRGDLTGSITVDPREEMRGLALRTLSIGGTMHAGALDITGDVGTIRTAGSLGTGENPDDQLHIEGNLQRLQVGYDNRQDGSVLAMDVVVLGDLRQLVVNGQVTGDVLVGGDLLNMQVRADNETGFDAAPAPTLEVGGLHAGAFDLFDVQALTVGPDGLIYVLHYNELSGEMELYAVQQRANGELVAADNMEQVLEDDDSNPFAGLSVEPDGHHTISMAFNPDDGLIYLAGVAGGGNLTLYAFNPATRDTATAVGTLQANGNNLTSDTRSVGGLSYNVREAAMYAVIHDTDAHADGSDFLYEVSLDGSGGTAAVEQIGRVRVDGIDTNVVGMDFVYGQRSTTLMAIDNDPDVSGDGRVIEIDLEAPLESRQLSDSGTVADNISGYAADADGNFYSVLRDTTRTEPTILMQSDYTLVNGNLQVGGNMNSFQVHGGHLHADVYVGGDLNNLTIRDGDFVGGHTIALPSGDLRSLTIVGGDLLGDVKVPEGEIGRLAVLDNRDGGGVLGGQVVADDLRAVQVQGDMLETSGIEVSGTLQQLMVDGEVVEGVTISADELNRANFRGDFAGELEAGYYSRVTNIQMLENFTGTVISNAAATQFNVRGDFGYDAEGNLAPATLLVGRDLNTLRVNGDTVGQITVNGEVRSMQFTGDVGNGSVDTVITTGFDLNVFRANGDVQRTLVQAGVASGRDLTFGTDDTRETDRMADIRTFQAGSLTDSIVAAGGDINIFRVNGDSDVVNSSVSTGLVLNTQMISRMLLNPSDGDHLTLDPMQLDDQNTLRSEASLYHGSFRTIHVRGDVIGSAFSAGVDPIDGDFNSANTILTSQTGGQSGITLFNVGGIDADSMVVTDAGINNHRIGELIGGATISGVIPDAEAYTVGEQFDPTRDIAPDLVNETADHIVERGQSLTLSNIDGVDEVSIDLRGRGHVEVYLNDAGDGIETLVLRGTDRGSRLSIDASEAGVVSIDRIITEDNASVGQLLMDDINLGTMADADLVDLWVDGDINRFVFHSMTEDATWSGRVGGGINMLEMDTQGAGRFMVGGDVARLSVADSTGVSLLGMISDVPVGPGELTASVQQLAINQAGQGFVYDAALGLVHVDVANGTTGDQHAVIDSYSEKLLTLNGMDANDVLLVGTSETRSFQPVVNAGSLANGHISLQSLAVDHSSDLSGNGDRDDIVYAIENSAYYDIDGFDDPFNPSFEQIVGAAWVSDETLFLVDQTDIGGGDFAYELVRVDRSLDGASILDVTTVGTLAHDNDMLFDVGSLEYDAEQRELLVVGRTDANDAVQRMYTVDLEDASADLFGRLVHYVPDTADGLNVTPTLQTGSLLNSLLADGAQGLSDIELTVNGHSQGGAASAGTFTNPGMVYGIRDGVILSTGNVDDYGDGPNEELANTTAYGVPATIEQQLLLQQVSGNRPYYDVTEIIVEFDLDAGFDEISFDVVFGSEEWPTWVGDLYIDAFGMFVNGANIAFVDDEPINIDHPDMAPIEGTELNGVLAPDGDPVLRFTVDASVPNVDLVTGGRNELRFMIADTGDMFWDSTAYISGLTAGEMPAPDDVTWQIKDMAFRPDDDLAERRLYGVAEVEDGLGNTETRLVEMVRDFNGGVSVGTVDLGAIEVDGESPDIQGLAFDDEGRLVGQAVDGDDTYRVLINTSDPTRSHAYSQPGMDPEGIYALAGSTNGQQVLAAATADDGSTRLVGFNPVADRLVQVDLADGSVSVVGEFVTNSFSTSYFNNVEQIAFSPDGTLYALLNDLDGVGRAFNADDGAALARIDMSNADNGGSLQAMNADPAPQPFNALPSLIDGDPLTAGRTVVTDSFSALSVSQNGVVYAVQSTDSGERLVQMGTTAASNGSVEMTDIGATTINAQGTQIAGMGFDRDNNLMALNRNGDASEVIALSGDELADPSQWRHTSIEGLLDGTLGGFAVGGSGPVSETYAYDTTAGVGGTFYTSAGAAPALGKAFVPENLIGSTIGAAPGEVDPISGLGDAYDVRALAVVSSPGDGDRYIAIHWEAPTGSDDEGFFRVLEFEVDGPHGAVSNVVEGNAIMDVRRPGPSPVQNIHAAAGNHLGEIYIVGTVGNGQNQEVFRLDRTNGEATLVGTLNDGRAVRDDVSALAFDRDTNRLYAVVETRGGAQELLRIHPDNAQATNLGEIRVDGGHAQIHSADFGVDGRLYAIETTPAGSRVLDIDVDDPVASSPVSARGSVNDYLQGYAADRDGRFFSVYNDGQGHNSQLWASGYDDRATVFGQINPADGSFTQTMPLLDGDGQLIGSRVVDITVDEEEGLFYSLLGDGRVFVHDASDGRYLADYGTVVSDAGDGELRLTRIEWQPGEGGADGQLLGIDARFNQLARIDVDPDARGEQDGYLMASLLGESGSINAGRIADLSYDPATEELLAVTAGPNGNFARFLDTSDVDLGGLYAQSFRSVTINVPDADEAYNLPEFDGRLVARGADGFANVRIDGDFAGSIISAGVVRSLNVQGDFGGTLQAWDDINNVNIQGSVLGGSTIFTSDDMRMLRVNDRDDVFFNGVLVAQSVNVIHINGSVLDSASISVNGDLNRLIVGDNFDGEVEAGSIMTIQISGDVGRNGYIATDGDVRAINILQGTGHGSVIHVGGDLTSLNIRDTHRGMVATMGEMRMARLADVTAGSLVVGTDLGNVSADTLTDALISSGVWVGQDHTYNTEHDVIFGGSIRSVQIRGDMNSSVVAAGVLPDMDNDVVDHSPNIPALTRAFIGYELAPPGQAPTTIDDAEAGGLLPSRVHMLNVRGNITTSDNYEVQDGIEVPRHSVVAAADGINFDRFRGNNLHNLETRVYNDPFGAPAVAGFNVIDGHSFEIMFTEEINTSSLVLSQDNNGDGRVTGVADVLGTVLLTDENGTVFNDVNLTYRVEQGDDGPFGVLKVISPDGFGDAQLSIELSGAGEGDAPAIFDRSGGRSILRNLDLDPDHRLEAAFGGNAITNFSDDPFGTILDGDNTGSEGGRAQFLNFFGGAPDDFLGAMAAGPVMEGLQPDQMHQTVSIGNGFNAHSDVDVYYFTASAYDFLSAELVSDAPVTMGIFMRDHQGDPLDFGDEEGLAELIEEMIAEGDLILDDIDEEDLSGLTLLELIEDLELVSDTFELLTRYEVGRGVDGSSELFQAVELPSLAAEPGSELDLVDRLGLQGGNANGLQEHMLEFFVVVAPDQFREFDVTKTHQYRLDLTMAQTDDMLDGRHDGHVRLPEGEQIAYISSSINDGSDPNNTRGNLLGYNDPRQMVFLEFGGGVSQQVDLDFDGQINAIRFDPFDASVLDPTFAGINAANELLISGGEYNQVQINGMVDSVMSIYGDTPASHPLGMLNVEFISNLTEFEDSYMAPDASGVFFSTIDPMHYGLKPDEYTTVFVGEPQTRFTPPYLGLAQDVDLANMNKGLDALVPTQMFSGISSASATADRLNDYSTALANVIAHELGHVLGFNHHGDPNPLVGNLLQPDPPSNTPGVDDSNRGISVMGAGPTSLPGDLTAGLWQFGTARLNPTEFPIGHIDHVDQLLRWLGPTV